MAYQQKYYKVINSHGIEWRLEIWQDSEQSLIPVEIGPVLQGLRLVVQGDQADIDTPIIKTSLEMVFIDAPGLDYERKCGYWEEFYTSSATEYMVRLYKDREIEWTGYITPDSFAEDLCYRGSVSIIARDNLGYMQDFMCSAYTESGLLTFRELFDLCLEKASFGMDVRTMPLMGICASGNDMPDLTEVMFNTSAFKDKTLWDALESAMLSLGLALRYIGGNTFALSTIREASKCGHTHYYDMRTEDVKFLSYGRRELTPSVKSVSDAVDFEIMESVVSIDVPESQYGEAGELACLEIVGDDATKRMMPVYAVNPQGGAIPSISAGNSRVLNPFIYKLKPGGTDSKHGPIYSEETILTLNNTATRLVIEDDDGGFIDYDYRYDKVSPVIIRTPIQVPGALEIGFTFGWPVVLHEDGRLGDFSGNEAFIMGAGFRAKWEGADGEVKYLSQGGLQGYWVDSDAGGVYSFTAADKKLSNDVTITLPALTVASTGHLTIELYGAIVEDVGGPLNRSYIRLKDIIIRSAEQGKVQVAQKSRVTTNYSAKNNLLLQRSPDYCPNSGMPLAPQMVVNNIYTIKDGLYVGAYEWQWYAGEEGMPLPALIHQELLTYYAKPNSVLSGELYVEDEVPDFATLWRWKNVEHTLISGQLNILTGRMENAVLREFIRYDHMWETWVENEDIEVDYIATSIELIVHSTNLIALNDVQGLPIWLTLLGLQMQAPNVYIVTLGIDANTETINRKAIILVKSAFVRITQLAPGDYGMDYGEDYS